MGTGRSAWVCCDSWSSQRRNSRDAEHEVVEAQNRVGGRLGAANSQVDTRVLVRTDKWYGSKKAWPIWSFVTRAYAGAIDRELSSDTMNAEISTNVVSNVQLESVQLYVVVIMLCTGRALDCAVSAVYSWAWRMFCHSYSLLNDARLVVLMLELLAILLDTKDVGGQSGCWMHRNDKHRFGCIERGCFYERIQRGFQGLWRGTGLRVRVLVLREATVSIRLSQDEAGPRHVTVEGSEGSRQQRKEQESSSAVASAAKRACSKQAREAW